MCCAMSIWSGELDVKVGRAYGTGGVKRGRGVEHRRTVEDLSFYVEPEVRPLIPRISRYSVLTTRHPASAVESG